MEQDNIRRKKNLMSKSNRYFLLFLVFFVICGVLMSLKLKTFSDFINLQRQERTLNELALNFQSQDEQKQKIIQQKTQENNYFKYHLKYRNLQTYQIDEHPVNGASINYQGQQNNVNYVQSNSMPSFVNPADIITLNVEIPQIGSLQYQYTNTINTPTLHNNQNTLVNSFYPTNMHSSFDNSNYQKIVSNTNQNPVQNLFYTNMPNDDTPQYPKISQFASNTNYITNLSYKEVEFAKRLAKIQQETYYEELVAQERQYYENKYKILEYEEQPFCIMIPSFNNAVLDRYMHNLNSILQQDYSNYHIVFIDDASDDETADKVRQFAFQHQISQAKLKIITNTERTMAMPNIYRAAKEYCQPHEIFMIVDGDDELIGTQVLKLYNALFQKNDYWLVYTNFMTTFGAIGYSRAYSPKIIQNKLFRQAGFVISHLRAFYTKLLTLVKEQDLKDEQGKWFRAANDVAMYMPILQMAQKKFSYIPQICYLYNSNTGLNNHSVKRDQQRENQMKIKSRQQYPTLSELFTQAEKQNLKRSMNQKIPLKDLSLSFPDTEVKRFKWE